MIRELTALPEIPPSPLPKTSQLSALPTIPQPSLFFEIAHERTETLVLLDQRFHVFMGVVANLEDVVLVSSIVICHRKSRVG